MIGCHQIAKWKMIGLMLDIPIGTLDIIEHDCNNKAEMCCMSMLTRWCDVDHDASLKKLKEGIGRIKSTPASIDSSVIDCVQKFLQRHYGITRCNTSLNLDMPYRPEDFTNVAFIHHKHNEVTEESVIAVANVLHHGDIIVNDDQLFQHNDYYASCTKGTDLLEFLHKIDSVPDRKPFLLLIEGAPGIGKTTVCKEIAFQWSKHQRNDLTFLICLHEFAAQSINSFKTLFEYICHGMQKTHLENISNYLTTGVDKRVMVIIDGYEEIFNNASESKEFINNIIKHDVLQFQSCDLVISTRCAAALVDLSHHRNKYRVEILGFTEELQWQYFKRNINQNDIFALRNHLNSKPLVKSFCFYPLFINFIGFLYNQLKILPILSELMDTFACVMVLWALRSQQEHSILDITLSASFKGLPEKCQNNLRKVCNLAFNSLKEKFEPDTPALVGRLSYETRFGFFKMLERKKKFCFHLPLIQEFLAAFFVTLSSENLKNLWVETQWNYKFINVWAYYFGLVKVIPEELKSLLLTNNYWFTQPDYLSSKILRDNIKCLYLVYCLMELPHTKINQQAEQQVIKHTSYLDISNDNLNSEYLNVVAAFLLYYRVRQWEYFSISDCSIDDNKLENLLQLFLCKIKHLPNINILDLSNNQLTIMSVNKVIKIAHMIKASKILVSHNKIGDKEICSDLVSFTETPSADCNLNFFENNKSCFFFCKIELCNLQSLTTLTNLYIMRCSLDDEVLNYLVEVLKTHKTLSLLCLYDNNLLCDDLKQLFEALKFSKHLKSFLIFEKSLPDDIIQVLLSVDFTLFQLLLVSANKLLAQGAVDHHILMALEYNPSTLHLQLNDCHVTDQVICKIAAVNINSSPKQMSYLDLSGNEVNNNSLRVFCNALDGECAVNTIKLAGNRLTSLPLVAELIYCLNPKVVDISKNGFTNDDSQNSLLISMLLADQLFAHDKQSRLTLICGSNNVLLCNQTVITAEVEMSDNFTQVFFNNCTISSELLLQLMDNNGPLTLLHLAHTKWSGEPLYNLIKFFKADILFSICENTIPFKV